MMTCTTYTHTATFWGVGHYLCRKDLTNQTPSLKSCRTIKFRFFLQMTGVWKKSFWQEISLKMANRATLVSF
jgi:hypothetical protein